jgi:hypothetical protein
MPPTPQSLRSSTVNPANLVELQVLTQVVTQLQSKDDILGSIAYLSKIVQIIENQRLDKPNGNKEHYYQQFNQLRIVKADAHAQLADAYFKTQQFILCESSLLTSVKIWEKLVQHNDQDFSTQLKHGYGQLKTCYEAMGKNQLAQYMDTKLCHLTSKK